MHQRYFWQQFPVPMQRLRPWLLLSLALHAAVFSAPLLHSASPNLPEPEATVSLAPAPPLPSAVVSPPALPTPTPQLSPQLPPQLIPKPHQWLCVLLHPKWPPRLCPQPAPPHSRRRRPVWHWFLALNPFLHLVQSLPVPMPLFPRLKAPLQAAAVENTVGKVQIRSGGRSPARWSKSCKPEAMM